MEATLTENEMYLNQLLENVKIAAQALAYERECEDLCKTPWDRNIATARVKTARNNYRIAVDNMTDWIER